MEIYTTEAIKNTKVKSDDNLQLTLKQTEFGSFQAFAMFWM